MAARSAYEWWLALSDDTKRRLIVNPDGSVPDDLVAEVTGAGAVVVGAWWPTVQDGPDGVFLPPAYREELRTFALLKAWTDADAAYEAENGRYFVIADYPLVGGAPTPELTFDEAAAARLDVLRVAAVEARETYERHVQRRAG
jgi:hypothetical protein